MMEVQTMKAKPKLWNSGRLANLTILSGRFRIFLLAAERRQSAARNEAHHEVKLKLSFNEDSEQEEELLLEFISDSYWWEEHNQAVGGVAPSGLDSTGGPATSLEELLDILQWS